MASVARNLGEPRQKLAQNIAVITTSSHGRTQQSDIPRLGGERKVSAAFGRYAYLKKKEISNPQLLNDPDHLNHLSILYDLFRVMFAELDAHSELQQS